MQSCRKCCAPPRYIISIIQAATSENVPSIMCTQWRLSTKRILDSQGYKVSSCAERRHWSDCVDTLANSNLRWAHLSEGSFCDGAIHLLLEDTKDCVKECLLGTCWQRMIRSAWVSVQSNQSICYLPDTVQYTVDSRYLEFQGIHWNTSRYPYFDISVERVRNTINWTITFNKWICNLTPEVRNIYIYIYIYKIMWKRGEIAPEEQFLLFSTLFCYLLS